MDEQQCLPRTLTASATPRRPHEPAFTLTEYVRGRQERADERARARRDFVRANRI